VTTRSFAIALSVSLGLSLSLALPGATALAGTASTFVATAVADAHRTPIVRLVQADAADEAIAIIASSGGEHRFSIEVADTPDERAQGLMFRETMAADVGMLFDYGTDQTGVAFWMKNTPLPLDMIFIRADGTITQIAVDTTPYSLEPIASREPVRFVLEVNAGITAKLGITPGDRLRHPRVTGP
jgi:uncharacterized membrane protein (UPF0127 family)